MAHVEKLPRSQWKLGLVLELITGRDTKVRGAKIGLSRTNTIITKPINKPYLVKHLNTNNTSITINKDTVQKNTRPKRKATFIGKPFCNKHVTFEEKDLTFIFVNSSTEDCA